MHYRARRIQLRGETCITTGKHIGLLTLVSRGLPRWRTRAGLAQRWSGIGITVPAGLFRLVCPGWPVPAGLSRLACPVWPGPAGLSRLACPGWPVPAGLSRLAWTGWPGPAGLDRLAWTGWPGPAGMSRLACPGQPVPAGLDRLAWTGWPGPAEDAAMERKSEDITWTGRYPLLRSRVKKVLQRTELLICSYAMSYRWHGRPTAMEPPTRLDPPQAKRSADRNVGERVLRN